VPRVTAGRPGMVHRLTRRPILAGGLLLVTYVMGSA
jgi:hypothetical protein